MKIKILEITGELILDIFKAGQHYYESTQNALPDDIKFKEMYINDFKPNILNLVLESETFEDMKEGERIPLIDPRPVFKRF